MKLGVVCWGCRFRLYMDLIKTAPTLVSCLTLSRTHHFWGVLTTVKTTVGASCTVVLKKQTQKVENCLLCANQISLTIFVLSSTDYVKCMA
jgi:hypothetical protein